MRISTNLQYRLVRGVSALLIAGLLPALSIMSAPVANAVSVTLAETDALVFNRANGVTNIVGNGGTTVNDVVLYKNVGTFGGVAIDAAITTVSLTGTVSNYDNPGSASTATGYANNWMINTVGGAATFKFEFFQAGTYKGANTGIPVVLQNVKITSIDIDTSGTGAYQYTDFTGFQKYSLMSPTNLAVKTVGIVNNGVTTPGVRFIAAAAGSRSSVPQDQVLVKYDAVQTIQMTFGNLVSGSTNYFGLVFGGWPGTGLPVEYPNVFNTPPTSSNTTQYAAASGTTTVPKVSFGNYSDADNNPFYQVKIVSVSSGTLQKTTDGTNWSTVSANSTVLVSDIEKGYLRFNATGASGNPVITFNVHDGLVFSTATNTLTLTLSTNSQTISFANPGTKTSTGVFASGATTNATGLVPTLTSSTTGVCIITDANGNPDANGLYIKTLTTGTCVITANQSGDATYSAAAPVEQTFVITAGSSGTAQTISFANPGQKMVSSTSFASGAKATSGLPVTLTSTTLSKCTVSGLNITAIATGTCTIVASQPGDGTFTAAPDVTQSFEIVGSFTTPAVWTMGAQLTGSSTATLTGLVDHLGVTTSWQICYKKVSSPTIEAGTNRMTDSSQTCSSAATLSTSTAVPFAASINVTGLSKDSTYSYQIVAWHNSSYKVYGQVFKFMPRDSGSTIARIKTNAQTNLTTTSATLNGQIYTSSTSTKVTFCISPTYSIKSGSFAALASCAQTLNAATSTQKDTDFSTSANVTGLTAYTPYYYQVIASRTRNGSTTTAYGNIVRFLTDSIDSVVTTLPATNVESTTATLNASVVPNGPSSTIKFCYSSAATATSRTHGSQLNTCLGSGPQTATPGSATGFGSYSASYSVSGLTSGTYYYQVVLSNVVNGTTETYYGNIVPFINGAPAATTMAASSIQATSGVSTWQATLNGFINTNGSNSIAKFCYNTNSASTNGVLSNCANSGPLTATPSPIIATDSRTATIALDVTGLTAGTVHYFQAIGYNQTDNSLIGYGDILQFTTATAPSVVTGDASSITSVQATLPGTITPNGATSRGSICVSRSNANIEVTGVLDNCFLTLTESADGTSISQVATGLANLTTYFYQAIATNSLGTSFGAIKSFTTAAGAPTATTLAATSVALNGTVMNGQVSPGGATTTATFCYLRSTSVPNTTAGKIDSCATVDATNKTIASTAGPTAVSATLGTLVANSTYYFQVVASNSVSGTNYVTYGEVLNFIVGAPTVTTKDATSIAPTSATLNGDVLAGSSNATVRFCLSTTQDVEADGSGKMSACYGATPTDTAVSATTGGTITSGGSGSATYSATSLVSGSTYYFQVVATNSTGTVYGSVLTFTVGAPAAVTLSATNVTATSAQLNGTIDPNNDTNVQGLFCISDSNELDADGSLLTCLNTQAPDQSSFVGNDALTAYVGAINLTPGTTYYYQLFAEGDGGFNFGAYAQFKTLFQVDFDPNEGTGTMSPQTGSGASAQNLSANGFTAPGPSPTFTGWNTAKNGSGRAFAAGASFDFKSNLTLYAQWTNTTYTLRYQSDPTDSAVTGTTAPADLVSAGTVNLASSASGLIKPSHRLTGWKIERTSVEYALGNPVTLSQNETATAIFSRYYTITFNINTNGTRTVTGSPSKSSDEFVVGGTAVALATQGSMDAGSYTFAGWGTATDSTTVLSGPITVSVDTTLYAVWSDVSYTITFNGNGSDGGSTADQSGVGNQTLRTNGYTKSDGYVFSGWSTTNNGSVAYANGATYNFSASTTLYAIWTKTYTVTFNGNGATSGSTAAQTASSSRALTANGFLLSGFAFSGWATTASGSVVYANSATYGFGADVTLYAIWSAQSSGGSRPTPTPTASPTPTPTASPTPSPSASATAKPTPSPSSTNNSKTSTFTLTTITSKTVAGSLVTLKQITPTPTATPKPSTPATPTARPSTPAAIPTPKPSPSASESSAPKPSASPSATTSPTAVPSPAPTNTPTVVTVGEGIKTITVTPTQVSVTSEKGFSGKTSVVVEVKEGNEITKVTVPVIVNPLEPITPLVRVQNPTTSTVSWRTDASATSYKVEVDGKVVCLTTSASCAVAGLVGPNSDVQVTAQGNDLTKSDAVPAIYGTSKPVTALVVYFATNSAVLTANDKKAIKDLASTIKEEGFKNVVINGHTDIQTGVDNKALSEARAKATLAYLKRFAPGVNAKIAGFASTKPAVKGNSPEALADNRRAEVGVY